MDVSHTDHSHIIGKGGGNIKQGRMQLEWFQKTEVTLVRMYLDNLSNCPLQTPEKFRLLQRDSNP